MKHTEHNTRSTPTGRPLPEVAPAEDFDDDDNLDFLFGCGSLPELDGAD